jgi:hypothetical protein
VKGSSGRVERLSVITLRASYASKMFQAFRRGEFGNRTIEEFMSELAEIMNTSPEMLRATYITKTVRSSTLPPGRSSMLHGLTKGPIS